MTISIKPVRRCKSFNIEFSRWKSFVNFSFWYHQKTSIFPYILSAKRSNLFRMELIFNCARTTLFRFFLRKELKKYLKFSLLLPFPKTRSILSSVNFFLISVISLSWEGWFCVWGDQIEYIFLIEFTNKSRNFAKPFKCKCNHYSDASLD